MYTQKKGRSRGNCRALTQRRLFFASRLKAKKLKRLTTFGALAAGRRAAALGLVVSALAGLCSAVASLADARAAAPLAAYAGISALAAIGYTQAV